jgi:hypothetical protein
MADTSLGFRYRGRLCGGPPTIVKFLSADTVTLYKGDLVSLDTGEVDIAATDDKTFLGVVNETKACVDSTTYVEVIIDDDSIFGVYDASARLYGAPLDLAGAAGSMTIAADSNHDLRVVAPSSATEETLVMFAHGAHVLNVTIA